MDQSVVEAQVKRVRAGVRRRLHRRLGVPLPPSDRRRLALEAVRAVEQLEPTVPSTWRPRVFWTDDRVAVRTGLSDEVRQMLPAPRDAWTGLPEGLQLVPARVSADAVVLAKLDTGRGVKMRAAYERPGLTVAVQPRGPSGVCGIARSVRAHAVVDRHAPRLMPTLRAHGLLPGGLRYLVEDWVHGPVARNSLELQALLPAILDGLARVHRGHGLLRVPPSRHWGPDLRRRWAATAATEVVPPDVANRVHRLLDKDPPVRVSWTHGDLVASNILTTDDGVVLLDWERSGESAVMNDMAKLHLFSREPDRALGVLLSAWPTTVPAGAASPAEELAIAHAQLLSRYPVRRQALARHHRLPIYERQVRRQVDRLRQVLTVLEC